MCRRSQSLPSWRHRGWAQSAWITIFNTPTLDEHLEGRQGCVKGTNYNQDPCTCQPVSDLSLTRACSSSGGEERPHPSIWVDHLFLRILLGNYRFILWYLESALSDYINLSCYFCPQRRVMTRFDISLRAGSNTRKQIWGRVSALWTGNSFFLPLFNDLFRGSSSWDCVLFNMTINEHFSIRCHWVTTMCRSVHLSRNADLRLM